MREVDALNSMDRDKISITGPYTEKDIMALARYSLIKDLALTEQELVTDKIAKGFSALQAVNKLWIWSSVTRTAMRDVIKIPQLKTLDILEIRSPGKLMYFEEASDLMVFRCNHYMSEGDLFEIAKIPNLEELGAQSAAVSQTSLEAILSMPKLNSLDLEGSEFDDDLARTISQSTQITALDIGSSNLTGKGLKAISQMKQLTSLDIWATGVVESDFKYLTELTNLEYLSLGEVDEEKPRLNYHAIKPVLDAMPNLKRLWLDGIKLTTGEATELNERYEYFRN